MTDAAADRALLRAARHPGPARLLELLPDWPELARGLDAVILAPGEEDCQGWYDNGIVAVCAWERELRGTLRSGACRDHLGAILRGLPMVSSRPRPAGGET